jgi:hypothetical protein
VSQENKWIVRFFLYWIGANLLGALGMYALGALLPIPRFMRGVVVFTLFLLPIGLAQWLVLRRQIPLSPLWILTWPAGVLLAALLMAVIPWAVIGDDESTLTLITMYVVIGAAIGLPQWLVLRRKVSRSGLWIAGHALAMGLGMALILVTGLVNTSDLVSSAALVLVYATATASLLTWLLFWPDEAYGQQVSVT